MIQPALKQKGSTQFSNQDPRRNFKNRRFRRRTLQSNFDLLDIYFWMHGVGFSKKYECNCKDLANFTASILLTILTDGSTLLTTYGVIQTFQASKLSLKKTVSIVIIMVISLLQRIVIYIHRKDFADLIEQLSLIYCKVTKRDEFHLKKKLKVGLTIAVTTELLVLYFRIAPMFKNNQSLIQLVTVSLTVWKNIHIGIAIYLVSLCFVFRKILEIFKRNLENGKSRADLNGFMTFSEITDAMVAMDDTFHDILAVLFLYCFSNMFHCSFAIIIDKNFSYPSICFNSVVVFVTTTCFIVVCLSSSSVISKGSEIKSVVCDQTQLIPCSVAYRLVLNVNHRLIGFALFDSITIDKSLIVSAFGTLFAFGIMIATFSLSSN